MFQTNMPPSSPTVTSWRSSGLKHRLRIAPECPRPCAARAQRVGGLAVATLTRVPQALRAVCVCVCVGTCEF